MTFASPGALTRRARPSHEPWIPLPYMLRAVDHLEHRMIGGLALDPGLRKTSITLAAFCNLKAEGRVRTMLVVAPLRVCRTVWRQEGQKWSQFRHLRFSLVHGDKKAQRLKDNADVWLINPAGVPWLCRQFMGRALPFDIVTIDELTDFKNAKSDRHKALLPRIAKVPRHWGLTGGMAPNGYLDLFGQQLLLDGGAALGKFITHYRDQYFTLDYGGFNYTLLPGAELRIAKRIAPYWLQMSADDYMELPPLIDDPREVMMEPPERALYNKMKRDMIVELPGGVVTAANAAAVYSKLAQMANGAVYLTADKSKVAVIHSGKLDALEELVNELNGEPLLVAYEFNHDLDRLRERFGADTPYLGKGTTAKQEAAWIAAWNRGELPLLFAHPASAGHGLNLQEANAAHVCWFGIPWALDLYDQFIKRLRRSGNNAQRIFNHLLVVRDTIDELKLDALAGKDMTQSHLLRILNTEILRESANAQAGGDTPVTEMETTPMVAKLSRQTAVPAATEQANKAPAGWAGKAQAQPQQHEQAQDQPKRVTPAGWGKANSAAQPAAEGQRERIAETIRQPQPETEQPEPQATARAAFSPEVRKHMQEVEQGVETALQPQTEAATPRRRGPNKTAPAPDTRPQIDAETFQKGAIIAIRIECLKIAFAGDGDTSLDDGFEVARKLEEYILAGPE